MEVLRGTLFFDRADVQIAMQIALTNEGFMINIDKPSTLNSQILGYPIFVQNQKNNGVVNGIWGR